MPTLIIGCKTLNSTNFMVDIFVLYSSQNFQYACITPLSNANLNGFNQLDDCLTLSSVLVTPILNNPNKQPKAFVSTCVIRTEFSNYCLIVHRVSLICFY